MKFRHLTIAVATSLFGLGALTASAQLIYDDIDFGDDSSEWANDGECDDPRFYDDEFALFMSDDDIKADATDCMDAYKSGEIALNGGGESQGSYVDSIVNGTSANFTKDGIDFGSDSSRWANDGECDDPRFEGENMSGVLLEEDSMADATDCLASYNAGDIWLIGSNTESSTNSTNRMTNSMRRSFKFDGIDFGDDSGEWANDGECDDPRFEGEGMSTMLIEDDLMVDASDCMAAYKSGSIRLEGTKPHRTNKRTNSRTSRSSIDFGDDSGDWANDGECDDPRFKGESMSSVLMIEDLMADASDCKAAFDGGEIEFNSNWEDEL